MFISFCGIDGCGKTTQSYLLKKKLLDFGIEQVEIVHGFKPAYFSGELKKIASQFGEDFHKLFSQEIRSNSFVLDLLNVTYKNILPALKEGKVIIAEKYFLDTMVYAPLLGSESDFLIEFQGMIPKPDLYLLLDIPPIEATNRIKKRSVEKGVKISPKETLEISKMARESFLSYAKKHENNCLVIDATKTISEVSDNCFNSIEQLLKKGKNI